MQQYTVYERSLLHPVARFGLGHLRVFQPEQPSHFSTSVSSVLSVLLRGTRSLDCRPPSFAFTSTMSRSQAPASGRHDHEAAPLLLNEAADDESDSQTYANTARNGVSTRRRRLFLGLSGAAIAIVGIVLLIVGLVFGLRIHKGNKQEIPDYSKLPGPKPGLRNPSYLVRGRHGAVATESEICSQIGLDVLKDGGTATDAAISGALCGKLAFPPYPAISG